MTGPRRQVGPSGVGRGGCGSTCIWYGSFRAMWATRFATLLLAELLVNIWLKVPRQHRIAEVLCHTRCLQTSACRAASLQKSFARLLGRETPSQAWAWLVWRTSVILRFVTLGFYHDQMFRAVFKALEARTACIIQKLPAADISVPQDAPTMPGDTLRGSEHMELQRTEHHNS